MQVMVLASFDGAAAKHAKDKIHGTPVHQLHALSFSTPLRTLLKTLISSASSKFDADSTFSSLIH